MQAGVDGGLQSMKDVSAETGHILPLADDVIAQIKSNVEVNTLTDAIIGLLRNSLDAGASKISIYLNPARGDCIVEDNGHGILPADFEEGGGLGKSNCMAMRAHQDYILSRQAALKFGQIPVYTAAMAFFYRL